MSKVANLQHIHGLLIYGTNRLHFFSVLKISHCALKELKEDRDSTPDGPIRGETTRKRVMNPFSDVGDLIPVAKEHFP